MIIKAKHIYLADLNPTIGSEIYKERPVLVIQKTHTIRRTVIILPISSKQLTHSETEYLLRKDRKNHLYKDSIVILDQVRAIDKQRIQGEIGSVSSSVYQEIVKRVWGLLEK